MNRTKRFSKTIVLFVASLSISVIFFVPSFRNGLVQFFAPPTNTVLSVLEISVLGKDVKILKVRRKGSIFLEVYGVSGDQKSFLIDRELLTDSKDAYYKLGEGRSNLFLQQVDGEGLAEVIAPTYDKNMQAHLNIFKIEEATAFLTKISKH